MNSASDAAKQHGPADFDVMPNEILAVIGDKWSR